LGQLSWLAVHNQRQQHGNMQLQHRDATSELDCSAAVVIVQSISVFATTDNIDSGAERRS
jgi:hypothetical protein